MAPEPPVAELAVAPEPAQPVVDLPESPAQAPQEAPQPKRRGRPPGSKKQAEAAPDCGRGGASEASSTG